MEHPLPLYTIENLPGGTLVYTTPLHPVTTDSLLLAAFCPLKPGWRVCDLGCGNGLLLLALADRAPSSAMGDAYGVDLDQQGLALLRQAAQDSGHTHIQAISTDLRSLKTARPFDLAISNPPYYSAGQPSPDANRARARHAQNGDIGDFCHTAARLLKDGGHLCLCWPATGLAALFAALAAAGFAPKRLQLVRKNAASAPWLALMEARKGGGEGLDILPDLLTGGTESNNAHNQLHHS